MSDVLVLVLVLENSRQLFVNFADTLDMFDHEKLDVYRGAIELCAMITPQSSDIPRGYGALTEQLRRASLSIPLNIAEACGRTSTADRQRFFAIARGSAMEWAAILDVCGILDAMSANKRRQSKQHLLRIVQMLSKLCR